MYINEDIKLKSQKLLKHLLTIYTPLLKLQNKAYYSL